MAQATHQLSSVDVLATRRVPMHHRFVYIAQRETNQPPTHRSLFTLAALIAREAKAKATTKKKWVTVYFLAALIE